MCMQGRPHEATLRPSHGGKQWHRQRAVQLSSSVPVLSGRPRMHSGSVGVAAAAAWVRKQRTPDADDLLATSGTATGARAGIRQRDAADRFVRSGEPPA